MTLPAALFTQVAPYAAWEFWVHLLSGGAVVVAAVAAAVFGIRYLWRAVERPASQASRALLFAAPAIVAAALWVVGTPPSLVVLPRALAVDMASALSAAPGSASGDPAVSAPTWAREAAEDVLNNYSNYAAGNYLPPMPAGYRLVLVTAPQVASLSGLLAHGDSAPIPNLAQEVLATLIDQIPLSAQSQIAAAHAAAVGVASGLAVTRNRQSDVLLIAIFVQAHG
jgi:hypothetical protein